MFNISDTIAGIQLFRLIPSNSKISSIWLSKKVNCLVFSIASPRSNSSGQKSGSDLKYSKSSISLKNKEADNGLNP